MKKIITILIVSATFCFNINGQTPYLVKNMNQSILPRVNLISSLTASGNSLFFANENGSFGMSLWKSDGTNTGTIMLKGGNNPSKITDVSGTVYYKGSSDPEGFELWKSDGTAEGTKMVKDINALSYGNSNPENLINVNGTLFFWADNGINGTELWKSNGTAEGTVMVKDINKNSSYDIITSGFTKVNDILFFGARTDSLGVELWKTDGTEKGTVLVKDIWPGKIANTDVGNGSFPEKFVNVNGTLFFIAEDGIHGRELWKSDGTEEGTIMVKDIRIKTGSGPTSVLTKAGSNVFFMAYDGIPEYNQLWKSDGTEAGTVKVKNISTSVGVQGEFTEVNGTLYFYATTDDKGIELWKSDGTDAGTTLVKDINLKESAFTYYSPNYLTNAGGTLYFNATDGINGNELWKSDGTAAGTMLVADIEESSNGGHPEKMTYVNGTLFFHAFLSNSGVELFALKTAPAAPTNLRVTPLRSLANPSKILLNWTDNSDNENGFIIERSLTSASGYIALDSVLANIASFVDSNFTGSAATYYYRVKSYNSAGSSAVSNIVSAIAEPNGIFEGLKSTSIALFPNPSSTVITLSGLPKGMEISVINALGETVLTNTISSYAFDLTIAELPKGIYLLQAQSTEKRYTGKFVKD